MSIQLCGGVVILAILYHTHTRTHARTHTHAGDMQQVWRQSDPHLEKHPGDERIEHVSSLSRLRGEKTTTKHLRLVKSPSFATSPRSLLILIPRLLHLLHLHYRRVRKTNDINLPSPRHSPSRNETLKTFY